MSGATGVMQARGLTSSTRSIRPTRAAAAAWKVEATGGWGGKKGLIVRNLISVYGRSSDLFCKSEEPAGPAAVILDSRAVLLRPRGERLQRGHQGPAQLRQPVLHPRRHLGVHLTVDQPRPLQLAQPLRQLLLRDRLDHLLEPPEPDRLPGLAQGEQDVHGPLVSDQVDGSGGRAILVGRRWARCRCFRLGQWLFPGHWYPDGAYVSKGCLLDERYQTVRMQIKGPDTR